VVGSRGSLRATLENPCNTTYNDIYIRMTREENLMPMKTVDGPRGKLAVYEAGSGGLPVVFLHCDAGNATQWSEQVARLSTSRHAIALDLRGHGGSDPPKNQDYSVQGRAEDVAALEIERFLPRSQQPSKNR
jgi:hypothetical protein